MHLLKLNFICPALGVHFNMYNTTFKKTIINSTLTYFSFSYSFSLLLMLLSFQELLSKLLPL